MQRGYAETDALTYISPYLADDARGGYRGANHYLYGAMARRMGVVKYVKCPNPRVDFISKWTSRSLTGLTGRRLLWSLSGKTIRRMSEDLRGLLDGSGVRHAFAFGTPWYMHGMAEASYSCYLDSALVPYLELYEQQRRYAGFEIRRLESLEREWLHHARLIFTSSDYARIEIVKRYDIDAGRVICVGIGPNLESLPERSRSVNRIPDILFLSTDYVRKRGDMAVESARRLAERMPGAGMHIIGDHSLASGLPRNMIAHGWLDRSDPDQAKTYDRLMRSCSLALALSLADLTPNSICESMAYGLPTLAIAVGGIPEMINDGYNGWLLSTDAGIDDVVDKLGQILSDPNGLEQAGLNARKSCETKWNWDAVADRIVEHISGAGLL